MDIDKEREAFEAYMAEKYKNLMDRRQCLNNGGGYMAWDMNVAWRVWQAAKAQAASEVINIGNEFEIGYTPNNLKALRAKHNLTQKQVAEITDTKAARTISKWETDLDDISHADMPAKKWRNLLKSLNYPIDK